MLIELSPEEFDSEELIGVRKKDADAQGNKAQQRVAVA